MENLNLTNRQWLQLRKICNHQKPAAKYLSGTYRKRSKLNGIALKGETGEGQFVPIIDIAQQKHVTFLPYELYW